MKRDENGLIIPNSDTLVVPYLYSQFKLGGLKTVIASIPVNGYRQYTYVRPVNGRGIIFSIFKY